MREATRARLAGALVVLTLSLAPDVGAKAAPPAAVVRAARSVEDSQKRWEEARRAQEETRSQFDALEHRIAALKRLRVKQPLTEDRELSLLLRASVDADQAARAQAQTVSERSEDVRRIALHGISVVDVEIKALLPALRQGTTASRKAAARSIYELRATRNQMKDALTRLRVREGATPKEWSHYEVAIDPLDGPVELQEKADFVEDTRDKFMKKRQGLLQLLREAKEEQEIARAAADFQTDVRHFDEEARTGRIPRKNESESAKSPSGTTVLAAPGAQNRTSGPTESPETSSPPVGATSAPAPFGGEAAPQNDGVGTSLADQPTAPAPSSAGDRTPSSTPGRPSAASDGVLSLGVPIQSSPQSKAIDPNVLLNLSIEDLASGQSNVATLEALVSDLERLDAFLDRRARTIRRRAKELREDEAKALHAPAP